MLPLAEHQTALAGLIKGRGAPDGAEPWYGELARSRELALVQEIAVFWRMIAVEGTCTSLARLLKRLGRFEADAARFTREENVSPYAGRAAEQFLARLAGDADPLVAAMAAFERAVMTLRMRAVGAVTVEWDRDPNAVFAALSSQAPLPPPEPGARYRLTLDRSLDGMAQCERLEAPSAV